MTERLENIKNTSYIWTLQDVRRLGETKSRYDKGFVYGDLKKVYTVTVNEAFNEGFVSDLFIFCLSG